jgi:hypothetical protein
MDQVMRAPKFLNYIKRKTPQGEHYPAPNISLLADHHKGALIARVRMKQEAC